MLVKYGDLRTDQVPSFSFLATTLSKNFVLDIMSSRKCKKATILLNFKSLGIAQMSVVGLFDTQKSIRLIPRSDLN